MRRGVELTVTFHGKPMAIVTPYAQWKNERDELESLRAELQRLRSQLGAEAMPAA
jgi:antitoxin (DNA-binding transcriptional repressor) of toxin-antitoxin stability system